MMRARRWAALLAVGMLPLGLAACGPSSAGPDAEAEAAIAVERAVVAAVPEALGAFVTTASSGPTDRTMRVRLYLDPTDSAALADAVDRAAAAAWASTTIAIVRLTLEAVPGQRPQSPARGVEQVIDLATAGGALGIDARQLVDGRLVLPEATLIERYGSAGGDDR